MIKNKKEKIVYELLQEEWPTDEIIHQYRFTIPYKFKKIWLIRGRIQGCCRILSGKYIQVDFFNKTKNIVIEVDNVSHASDNARRKDKAKDKKLVNRGYKVIRLRYDIDFIEGTKKLLEIL